MRKKTGRKFVDDPTFVKTLLSASGPADAAKKLGMSPISVQARAARLRKAGVKLPKFRRSPKEVDVEGLNKLVATLIRNRV